MYKLLYKYKLMNKLTNSVTIKCMSSITDYPSRYETPLFVVYVYLDVSHSHTKNLLFKKVKKCQDYG